MLGGAAMGKMPQSVQPKEEEEPIENFLSCKVRNLLVFICPSVRIPPYGVVQDKDVKVKLRIHAEGVYYEIETDAETDFVQKFVAKLLVRLPMLLARV